MGHPPRHSLQAEHPSSVAGLGTSLTAHVPLRCLPGSCRCCRAASPAAPTARASACCGRRLLPLVVTARCLLLLGGRSCLSAQQHLDLASGSIEAWSTFSDRACTKQLPSHLQPSSPPITTFKPTHPTVARRLCRTQSPLFLFSFFPVPFLPRR